MARKFIRLTNCRLVLPWKIEQRDLHFDADSGIIIDPQAAFYDQKPQQLQANALEYEYETLDLGGQMVAPGLIDVQINGGFGMDFSVPLPDNEYRRKYEKVTKELVKTGVTSFCPTMTSQGSEVYHQVLPHLAAPRGRHPSDGGAESLGAHVEGPFINPSKKGIHSEELLKLPKDFSSLESCYGAENLKPPCVKLLTIAPELDPSGNIVRELVNRGIAVSMGHSAATTEQAMTARHHGASMITHLYNAMDLHHRDAGIVGMLGTRTSDLPIYFGIIADGVHVHPSMVRLAFEAHRDGCILVTDAMRVLGLPDGEYEWTNGERITLEGSRLTLNGTNGKLAGSCITLIECVNNLLAWTDATIESALRTVTQTPAKLLGLDHEKGGLEPGMYADFVILDDTIDSKGRPRLVVKEVWKKGLQASLRDHIKAREMKARL